MLNQKHTTGFRLTIYTLILCFVLYMLPLISLPTAGTSQLKAMAEPNYAGMNLSGWHVLGGYTYYFDPETGEPYTGYRRIGNTRYLFNSLGQMQTGWHVVSGKTYYFSPDHGGGQLTGRRLINRTEYLLSYDGVLTGWHLLGGNAYYYSPEHGGGRLNGMRRIGNTYYLLSPHGKQTGWHVVDGNSYYFSPEHGGGLLTGMRKIGGTYYLLSLKGKQTGWHVVRGNAYYFSPENGGLLTGKRTIGNTTYLLSLDGKKTGWHEFRGRKYYFSEKYNGAMLTGLRTIDDTKYYFNEDGVLIRSYDWTKQLNSLPGKRNHYNLYYIDLASGYEYSTGSEVKYPASLPKIYVAGVALDLAINGQIEDTPELRSLCRQSIVVSSNDAFNLLLLKIGKGNFYIGCQRVNDMLREHGLTDSTVNSMFSASYVPFQSIKGAGGNKSSPRDMAHTMQMIYHKAFISEEVSEILMGYLLDQEFNHKIPAKLPNSVKVAHKTGEVWVGRGTDRDAEHDVAIIFTEECGDYVFVVFTSHIPSQWDAQKFIQNAALKCYEWHCDATEYRSE